MKSPASPETLHDSLGGSIARIAAGGSVVLAIACLIVGRDHLGAALISAGALVILALLLLALAQTCDAVVTIAREIQTLTSQTIHISRRQLVQLETLVAQQPRDPTPPPPTK